MSRVMSLATNRLAAIAAAAAFAFVAAAPVAEAQRVEGPTIVISGTGTASAAPDVARISAGVETVAETAAAALAENTETMTAVMDALEAAGVDRTDIATTSFTVSPRYSDRRYEDNEPAQVTGYEVGNVVVVVVRDLDGLGGLLDTLVRTGANRINSIAFGTEDYETLLDQARRSAVADAQRKAELYAEAAGVTLGPVIRINEAGRRGPGPQPEMRALAMASPAPVPIAEGERAVTSTVTMVWRIAGGRQ